jgi:hypothetical protein
MRPRSLPGPSGRSAHPSPTIVSVAESPEQPDLERADCNCRDKDDYDRQEHFEALSRAEVVFGADPVAVNFVCGSSAVVGEPRLANHRGPAAARVTCESLPVVDSRSLVLC